MPKPIPWSTASKDPKNVAASWPGGAQKVAKGEIWVPSGLHFGSFLHDFGFIFPSINPASIFHRFWHAFWHNFWCFFDDVSVCALKWPNHVLRGTVLQIHRFLHVRKAGLFMMFSLFFAACFCMDFLMRFGIDFGSILASFCPLFHAFPQANARWIFQCNFLATGTAKAGLGLKTPGRELDQPKGQSCLSANPCD